MTDDRLRVRTASLNGTCGLRIAGELDTMVADSLAGRARAAVDAVPGPVLVDLSGLKFIDAHGARALDELIRTLAGTRAAVVSRCPLRVRRVLDRLGLTLDSAAAEKTFPRPAPPTVADWVRRARLDAARSRLDASGTLVRLIGTRLRVASTVERTGLLREQAQQALSSSRAARQHRGGPGVRADQGVTLRPGTPAPSR